MGTIGADIVLKTLEEEGVDVIFGYHYFNEQRRKTWQRSISAVCGKRS